LAYLGHQCHENEEDGGNVTVSGLNISTVPAADWLKALNKEEVAMSRGRHVGK
jgi:hypothetical protein